MMDKIPAALQHKIDYINVLDIPWAKNADGGSLGGLPMVSGGEGGKGLAISKIELEALKVGFESIKNTGDILKPIGPTNVKFKGTQPSLRYVAALFLAVILGNLLGFAIFTLLERIL
jgi:hypothetical protein